MVQPHEGVGEAAGKAGAAVIAGMGRGRSSEQAQGGKGQGASVFHRVHCMLSGFNSLHRIVT
jgi:hypothetical protein